MNPSQCLIAQTLSGPDADEWRKAAEEEYQSQLDHETWDNNNVYGLCNHKCTRQNMIEQKQ